MMKQVYNPYLPLYEYIPDGEPHVFGDRIYIYGSHDVAGGEKYCIGDYAVWSAPTSDLREWRCDGVSYKRAQDPSNADNKLELWAPDVAQGPDGRYYLYYCFAFLPEIGVAVSESPAGPFEFYGHVKYPSHIMEGKELNEHLPFDPAIFVDDDKRVYLYYGFSPAGQMEKPDPEALAAAGMSLEEIDEVMENVNNIQFSEGAMVAELEPDMLTMKENPELMIPGGLLATETSFAGHGFFEASSMRKVNGKYYFVYSSQLSHELCYATSNHPDCDFVYGGTIISNGDIGLDGNESPVNMMGNNHGGIVQVKDEWYVFYHRQTHGTESSRQGCAERIYIDEDGNIKQVAITSCGLNGGPLMGEGTYPAAIACHLTAKQNAGKITFGETLQESLPYIYEEHNGTSEEEHIQYVANISDEVKIGYKYFDMQDVKQISLLVQGQAEGIVSLSTDIQQKNVIGQTAIKIEGKDWINISVPVCVKNGEHALYVTYQGSGAWNMREIKLKCQTIR